MITGVIDSGQKIITNGLVLHYDAAQLRSYPGSGTTWTDLSGNSKTGTLTNGPTFNSGNGGSIVFDGNNDFVAVAGSQVVSDCSVCVWGKTAGTDAYDGIVFNRGSGSNVGGLTFYTGAARIQYGWNDNNSGDTAGGALAISLNTWQMWSFTHTNTGSNNRTLYVNTTSSSITTAGLTSMTWSALRVGSDSFSTARSFAGNIAIVLIYTRRLSATEIAQNYNALRSRFGV
jgi:hypothetical protein